jgi:uncharacterized RDD family membrane protein YckC
MACPQCHSEEISASGVCPVCGYDASENAAASESVSDKKEDQGHSGVIEIDYSEGAQKPAQNEQPQWRRDLAQRLHAIKQKREAMDRSKQSQSREKDLSLSAHLAKAGQPKVITPATFIEGTPAYKPVQKPRGPVPKQKTLEPLSHESPAGRPSDASSNPQEVRTLIDNAIFNKFSQPGKSRSAAGLFESAPALPSDSEGKLILLSRTLSGMVDLIIVTICSGACILAADFFSGIIELDAVSYLAFSALFLLTYFLYSLFFLTAASQTIGMMITDLRIVSIHKGRPLFSQLLRRCGGHLVSILGLGFGLIWSLFDRESLCFHDRISGTHVIRA